MFIPDAIPGIGRSVAPNYKKKKWNKQKPGSVTIDCPVLLEIIFLVPKLSCQYLTFYNSNGKIKISIKSPIFSICQLFNQISHLGHHMPIWKIF